MSLVTMSDTEYHKRSEISSTAFREFLKSPAHYQTYLTSPREDSETLHFGRVFHARLLEGKNEQFTFNKTPAVNQRKTEEIAAMVARVRKNELLSNILKSGGEVEKSAFAKDPDTGLLLKARFDWISDGLILDLKTTSKSAKPEEFEKTIFNFGYHIQAAWYARVLKLATGRDCDAFLFAAIEKTAPHLVSVFKLKADVLAYAQDIISFHLPRLKACIEKNEFPGYSNEIQEIGLPAWVMGRAPILETEEVA